MRKTGAHRTGTVLLWAVLLLGATARSVVACWLAPPDIVWGKSGNANFDFKRKNRTGTITVYQAGNRERALWHAVVPEFDSLFSMIMLTNKGDKILHVRGNHMVKKFDDTAVHVFQQDGTFCTLKVREFTRSLAYPKKRLSITPKVMWLKTVQDLTDESFTIISAKGRKTTLTFRELARKMRRQ